MIITLSDPADPRISAYRNVRLRDPGDGFIAEGSLVVKRLLQSELSIRSLLIHKGQEHKYIDLLPDSVPAFVVEPEIGEAIAGYDFHRGVLAHGDCPPWLDCETLQTRRPNLALGLVGISDPENVGSLLRSAAAMGVHDILIGPATIFPYVRRVIRVSMASVFHHRFYRFDQPLKQIASLQAGEFRFAATTLAPDSIAIEHLQEHLAGAPTILLLGNEAQGLDADVQAACHVRTTLPMPETTDSLNVGVAGAIFLYELTKR
ncbi:TrmH family RNA methyltransferase [Aporhodopirellula aestuarii]|uniref:RNA methyltransferase n=1 Tax=Aporhodopirellula aestuarii TaxID=2950107 RepID=A0ABT0U5A5_9BACT|nr:RNA methyltransferase [Aporhodopirellula aestuarii]MCM2371987.1 RNA methyltransferase [Aporhodopirellula aestuarii]